MAKKDRRIFFVGSDLGFDTLSEFRSEISERFFIEGINEGNVIGLASGLALEGKIPYVNTIATFITRRAFEQIAVDICMHNVPVRLIGNGGGLVYAPLGSTHLAIEDISLMRALPNMTIVCPADAEEMARLIPKTVDYPGPIYIRLAKGYDPIVTKAENGFEIGKGVRIQSGDDALIVCTGITLQVALDAAKKLRADHINVGIAHMHTVKPFDRELLLDLAGPVPAIVSVEENTVVGGLGSAVAEVIAEANFNPGKRFKRVGIPDIFPDYYGNQKDLMNRFGIDSVGLTKSVKEVLDS